MKVVKISAEWCGPCKVLAPIFEELKNELESENLIFEVVTEDDKRFSEISLKFGIRSIPTVLIMDDWDITLYSQITGLKTKDEYKNTILDIVREHGSI
jgi:thioredoxin 1